MTEATEAFAELTRQGHQVFTAAMQAWEQAARSMAGAAARSGTQPPDMGAQVDAAFDFAAQMLADQREFTRTLMTAGVQAFAATAQQSVAGVGTAAGTDVQPAQDADQPAADVPAHLATPGSPAIPAALPPTPVPTATPVAPPPAQTGTGDADGPADGTPTAAKKAAKKATATKTTATKATATKATAAKKAPAARTTPAKKSTAAAAPAATKTAAAPAAAAKKTTAKKTAAKKTAGTTGTPAKRAARRSAGTT